MLGEGHAVTIRVKGARLAGPAGGVHGAHQSVNAVLDQVQRCQSAGIDSQ